MRSEADEFELSDSKTCKIKMEDSVIGISTSSENQRCESLKPQTLTPLCSFSGLNQGSPLLHQLLTPKTRSKFEIGEEINPKIKIEAEEFYLSHLEDQGVNKKGSDEKITGSERYNCHESFLTQTSMPLCAFTGLRQNSITPHQIVAETNIESKTDEEAEFYATDFKNFQSVSSSFTMRNDCNELSIQSKFVSKTLSWSNLDCVFETDSTINGPSFISKTEFSIGENSSAISKDIKQEQNADPVNDDSYFQPDSKCKSHLSLSFKPCRIISRRVVFNPREDEVLYICHDCKTSFKLKGALKKHIFRKHSSIRQNCAEKRKSVCELCGSCFKSPSNLHRHLFLFHQKKVNELLYDCDHCGNSFAKKDSLILHIQSQHSPSISSEKVHKDLKSVRFNCGSCAKSFASKNSLRIHRFKHTGQRKVCKLCDVAFLDPSNFNRHLREVHDLKPMHAAPQNLSTEERHCKICGQHFSRPSNLTRHLILKHSVSILTQSDSSKTSLYAPKPVKIQKHQNSGRALYNCKKCSALFYQSSHLYRHERNVHQRIRYLCTVCDMNFADRSNLRKHHKKQHGLTIHRGEVKGTKQKPNPADKSQQKSISC